jgi:hypothetical protein
LRWEVRRLTQYSSVGDRTKVGEKRQRLGRRIQAFHSKSSGMIGEFDPDHLILNEADVVAGDEIPDSEMVGSDGEEGDEPDDVRNWAYEVDVLDDEDLDDEEGIADYPEKIPLLMPSAIGQENIKTDRLKALASQELKLREGQANDCLECLRLALGHKALLFRTRVRNASSVKERTKAWDDVKTARRQVDKHVRGYHRARNAMLRLGGAELLEKYLVIERKDLALSGDITDANRLGQRNDKLAWFWGFGRDLNADNAWMTECACLPFVFCSFISLMVACPVYRVNWLRAKARRDRWDEELKLVKHEMSWVVLWFQHQRVVWEGRVDNSNIADKPGHRMYALKQVDLWHRLESRARRRFLGKMVVD